MQPIQFTEHDKYALRRVMTRKEVPGDLQLSPFMDMLLKSYNLSSKEDYINLVDVTTRMFGRMDDVTQRDILKIDPNAPAPEVKKAEQSVYIPHLPKEAQLSEDAIKAGEMVGEWYQDTVKWCSERSPMTPVHFLEVGVIWLIGLAVARRVYVELHERIYPHLYVLLVAETSKYAKSTGMNTIYSLVQTTMPHMLIPGQTSPEGMIELLSGAQPSNFDKLPTVEKELIEQGRKFAGQRGIIMDEFSSILAAGKKDYMAGFVELLMRLYDARDNEQHYTRSGGLISIKNPAIGIFGATTPAAMARASTNEDWENGANARYLMMFREEPLPYNPKYSLFTPPSDILTKLRFLHTVLPEMKDSQLQDKAGYQAIPASMSKDAFTAYTAYMKAVFFDMIDENLDERVHGNYRRMHIQALKIALAVACMDWAASNAQGKPVITLGHWAIGQQIAEKARESLHRMLPVLSESRDSRTQRDLLTVFRQNPSGLTIRDICRLLYRKTKDVQSAIQILVESGEIETINHVAPNGKTIQIYKTVSDK